MRREMAVFRGLFYVLFCGLVLAGADSGDSLGLRMIRIDPGTFMMGAAPEPLSEGILNTPGRVMSKRPAEGDFDETPAHKVTITYPFRISQTDLTIEQFRKFQPKYQGNPAFAPYAAGVSWHDAVKFCEWLSSKDGKSYRLPTEAEWEYAAHKTPPEVEKTPSGVAEWTLDWYGLYPATPQTDPVGRASGITKVVRGGGLDYRAAKENEGKLYPAGLPFFARPANRASMAPAFASPTGNIGFRVVEAPMPKTAPIPYDPPFFQSAVIQTAPDLTRGPAASKPYYHVRRLFPDLGGQSMRTVGRMIGLAPGLGIAYHNSAVQGMSERRSGRGVLRQSERRGRSRPDHPDAADAAPVFWNDRGRLWLFFGSPRLVGAWPFQYMTSMDSGATWTDVRFPNLQGPVGDYTPQPINSIVRASDGAIYFPWTARAALRCCSPPAMMARLGGIQVDAPVGGTPHSCSAKMGRSWASAARTPTSMGSCQCL